MDESLPQFEDFLGFLSQEPVWSAIFFLIISCMILVWALSRRQALLNQRFSIIEDKIDRMTKAVSSTAMEMENVKSAFGGVEDSLTGVNKVAEDTKRDLANLSDGISGETQISSAIELAREGAPIDKIVASTGISREEAEAVVRFHKPEASN